MTTMDYDTLTHIQALADWLEALRVAHADYAAAPERRVSEPLARVLDAVIGTLNANDALRARVGE